VGLAEAGGLDVGPSAAEKVSSEPDASICSHLPGEMLLMFRHLAAQIKDASQ
jgi:hypothetical protein